MDILIAAKICIKDVFLEEVRKRKLKRRLVECKTLRVVLVLLEGTTAQCKGPAQGTPSVAKALPILVR